MKSELIYARVTINSQRSEISLKQRIKAEDWSYEKGMAKAKEKYEKIEGMEERKGFSIN